MYPNRSSAIAPSLASRSFAIHDRQKVKEHDKILAIALKSLHN